MKVHEKQNLDIFTQCICASTSVSRFYTKGTINFHEVVVSRNGSVFITINEGDHNYKFEAYQQFILKCDSQRDMIRDNLMNGLETFIKKGNKISMFWHAHKL